MLQLPLTKRFGLSSIRFNEKTFNSTFKLNQFFYQSSSSQRKKKSLQDWREKNETEPRISFPRWKVILDLLLNNLGTFLILFEANLICMILSAYADKVDTRTLTHIHALNLSLHSHMLYRMPDIGTRSITCRHTHSLFITCNTYRLSQSLATRTHTRTERETLTVSLSYLHL